MSHNKNLSYINCHHNQLNELDVSGLPLLETFYCGHNALPSIDVSKNEKLEDFDCQDNHLDTLNVSQNKELVELSCGDNNLTELDVSENKKLKELWFYGDNLSNLDLGNQPELEVLSCVGNPLSVLNVSANTKLKKLYVNKTNLTSLDATNNTALEAFNGKDCSYNIAVEGDGKFDLTTLPGHFDASKATAKLEDKVLDAPVAAGTEVTLTAADASEGKTFAGWKLYNVSDTESEITDETELAKLLENGTATTATLTMPAYNVKAEPYYSNIPYNIKAENCTVDKTEAAKGETVTATRRKPEANEHFTGWTVTVNGVEQDTDTFLKPDADDPTKVSFVMPAENVEIKANFASNPTLNPTLRVGDHVTATIDGSDTPVPSGSAVPVGETVHLTAIAPEGQHFTGWTVKVGDEEQKADTFLTTPDENDPTKVTFTMPDANVEVAATFADDPIPEPDPVGPSDTGNIQGAISAVVIGAAAGAIIYEAGTGIYRVINMPGIPMPSNRIELAELLWEHAGKPEPVSTALYSDIDEGDTDAQKAARWAVEQDLMKDDADNNKFHPAFPVSKLRTCLTWNAAKEKGLFDKTEE